MNNHVVLPYYETVFFCIPKAANTSIKAAILTALGFYADEGLDHKHTALNISTADEIAQWFGYYNSYAIVRNPWDRLVSCYRQKILTNRVNEEVAFCQKGYRHNMPFDEFIAKVCEDPFANVHFYPQMEALSSKGEFLPKNLFYFEHLGAAWNIIRRRCIVPLGELPHYNASNGNGTYREYYTDDSREMVAEAYADDIERFRYRF